MTRKKKSAEQKKKASGPLASRAEKTATEPQKQGVNGDASDEGATLKPIPYLPTRSIALPRPTELDTSGSSTDLVLLRWTGPPPCTPLQEAQSANDSDSSVVLDDAKRMVHGQGAKKLNDEEVTHSCMDVAAQASTKSRIHAFTRARVHIRSRACTRCARHVTAQKHAEHVRMHARARARARTTARPHDARHTTRRRRARRARRARHMMHTTPTRVHTHLRTRTHARIRRCSSTSAGPESAMYGTSEMKKAKICRLSFCAQWQALEPTRKQVKSAK